MASCRIVPEDTETESAGKDNFLGWHIFTQNLIQIKSNPPKKWKWTYDCALKGVLYSTGARIDLHFDSDCRNWSFQELEISTLMWSLCLFFILWISRDRTILHKLFDKEACVATEMKDADFKLEGFVSERCVYLNMENGMGSRTWPSLQRTRCNYRLWSSW